MWDEEGWGVVVSLAFHVPCDGTTHWEIRGDALLISEGNFM